MENAGNKSAAAILRQKAEDSLKKKPSKSGSQLSEGDARKLIHELQVHQIELELQNEELLLAKSTALATSAKYTELYDFAPSGYFTISKESKIIDLNLCGSQMLGKERSRLKNTKLRLFISDDTKPIYNLFVEKAFTSKVKESCEVTLSVDGNSPLYVHLTGIVTDHGDKCLITMVDITERKRAEEALLEERQRLAGIIKGTNVGTWEWNVQTGETIFNDRWAEIIGCTLDEISPVSIETWMKYAHPVDLKESDELLEKHFHGKLDYYEFESRMKHKDGNWVWVLDRGKVTSWTKDGKPLMMMGTHQDVTAKKQAEEALRESEEKFRFLVNYSYDLIWILRPDGVFSYVSPSWKAILGYEPTYMVNKAFQPFVHPDDVAECERYMVRVMDAKEPLPGQQYRVKHADGSWRWHEGVITPVFADDGSFMYFVGVSRDITDRKHTEEALKKARDDYQVITNLTGDVIVQVDKEGRWTFLNDQACEFWGKPREELIGSFFSDYLHPDDQEETSAIIMEMVGSEDTKKDLVNRQKTPQGWRIVQWNGAAIYHDGEYTGFQATGRDITDRKRAEEALRQSQEKFRQYFENAPNYIYIISTEGTILDANPAAVRILGYSSKNELIGRHLLSTVYAPSSRDKARELLQRWGETGKLENEELRIVTGAGEERTIILNVSSVRDGHGQVIHSVSFQTDITDIKQAEDGREKLQAQLIQAQKLESIGTLAGGIAHDFNNLLMGIQGNTSLMMMDLAPPHPHYERLGHVEECIASGAELTRQLLGFARGGRYDVKPISMNDIVEKSCAMFGRTKKEISLHRKYAKPPCVVEVDRSQMEQVFMNLFVNAWQAMPGGGDMFVETEKVVLDEAHAIPGWVAPGRYVKVTVTDTGAGMDKQTKDRIFDPFFSTKGMGRGTGLGLATVYGILHGHGGMITVESEPGQGSSFTLYLPASEKDPVGEKKPTDEVLRGTETMLLVDDEKMVLDVTRRMLESLGYRVHAAGSGQEAVALYHEKKHEIDMVILDMIMPGISGGETFDRLREINPDVKVLLASGYSIEGQAQEIMDRGCNGFIQKPSNRRGLSRSVRGVLD